MLEFKKLLNFAGVNITFPSWVQNDIATTINQFVCNQLELSLTQIKQ